MLQKNKIEREIIFHKQYLINDDKYLLKKINITLKIF